MISSYIIFLFSHLPSLSLFFFLLLLLLLLLLLFNTSLPLLLPSKQPQCMQRAGGPGLDLG